MPNARGESGGTGRSHDQRSFNDQGIGMKQPRRRRQRPPEPPRNASEGAAWVRRYLIDLYDRRDGRAANWQLIAETAFKAAFEAADLAPLGDRKTAMILRLHAAAYDRLAEPSQAQVNEQLETGPVPTFEQAS